MDQWNEVLEERGAWYGAVDCWGDVHPEHLLSVDSTVGRKNFETQIFSQR
jgi:hypothetical protein